MHELMWSVWQVEVCVLFSAPDRITTVPGNWTTSSSSSQRKARVPVGDGSIVIIPSCTKYLSHIPSMRIEYDMRCVDYHIPSKDAGWDILGIILGICMLDTAPGT
jgi:hypothetical protein